MLRVVPSDHAAIIARLGDKESITLVNQSATDVWLDSSPNQLNTVMPGVAPAVGLKVAANGGELQWPTYAGREIWGRASAPTQIEIQP